jgi:forkhead box protein K
LHNNTLVLSPVIFSSLAPEQLKALEEMGAQKALEVLQGHIVRYLKERMGKKKRKKASPGGLADKGGTKSGKGDTSSPFTTVPLPSRTAQSTPTSQVPVPSPQGSAAPHALAQMPTTETTFLNLSDTCTPAIECSAARVKGGVASFVDNSPPVPVPTSDVGRLQTLSIVVVDEDYEERRVTKRRKLGNEVKVEPVFKHEGSTAQISQDVDEDIEVDVC